MHVPPKSCQKHGKVESTPPALTTNLRVVCDENQQTKRKNGKIFHTIGRCYQRSLQRHRHRHYRHHCCHTSRSSSSSRSGRKRRRRCRKNKIKNLCAVVYGEDGPGQAGGLGPARTHNNFHQNEERQPISAIRYEVVLYLPDQAPGRGNKSITLRSKCTVS